MGTYTTNYNLFMPTVGETGWGTLVNTNFTTIDSTMKALSNRITAVENEVNGALSCTSVTTSGKITANGGITSTTGTFSGAVTGASFNDVSIGDNNFGGMPVRAVFSTSKIGLIWGALGTSSTNILGNQLGVTLPNGVYNMGHLALVYNNAFHPIIIDDVPNDLSYSLVVNYDNTGTLTFSGGLNKVITNSGTKIALTYNEVVSFLRNTTRLQVNATGNDIQLNQIYLQASSTSYKYAYIVL